MHSQTPLPTSPASDGPWIVRPRESADAPIRLLCLSYAGGGASAFRAWPARLPGVEVLAIQPPGRETRMLEEPFRRIAPLVTGIADALRGELDTPYAIFGHSMGARAGFELARELRRRAQPGPTALFVSSCKAPHLPRAPLPPFESMPENVFLARLRNMNGTPPEVFDHPELLELVLPAIRADFAVVDNYEYTDEAALDCPIRAFGGTFDTEAREDELLAWQAHTTQSFNLQMLAGGHFTIVSHEQEITAAVAADLAAIAR
jgi:medium-chain acyl-[acyl-carrier-protein] hydrolase